MRRTSAFRAALTSDTALLLLTAALIGLLFGALIGGWGGVFG